MCTKGEGELTHPSTYAKSPFYHALLSMVMTFIAVLKCTCHYYFPVSLIFYSLVLYGLSDWIFQSFPIRNGGGGVRWERVRTQWGDRSKRTCACDGGGGEIFATLVRAS